MKKGVGTSKSCKRRNLKKKGDGRKERQKDRDRETKRETERQRERQRDKRERQREREGGIKKIKKVQ